MNERKYLHFNKHMDFIEEACEKIVFNSDEAQFTTPCVCAVHIIFDVNKCHRPK